MSNTNLGNQTSSDNPGDDEFPIAAIVCIAVGAYVILIIGFVILRQQCIARGSCQPGCCQGKSDGAECRCNTCSSANEACPCCCRCNLDGCLSRVCGKPRKINCIDIILCNCGGCTERCCNCVTDCTSCCKDIHCCSCSGCKDGCTGCWDGCCGGSETGTWGCLCLEIKLRSPRDRISKRRTSAPAVVQNLSGRKDIYTSHNLSSGIQQPDENKIFTSKQKWLEEGDATHKQISSDAREISHSSSSVRPRSLSYSPSLDLEGQRYNSTAGNKLRSKRSIADSDSKITSRSSARDSSVFSSRDSGYTRKNSPKHSDSQTRRQGSGSIEDLKVTTDRSSGSRRSSKLRKTVRSGQRSQRFPSQFLVSSESLSSGRSCDQDSVEVKGRSLPEPHSSTARRPLPPLRNVNRTH